MPLLTDVDNYTDLVCAEQEFKNLDRLRKAAYLSLDLQSQSRFQRSSSSSDITISTSATANYVLS